MTIRQKLELIQKMTGLTQTKLAEKMGVSFATFNSWWNEKTTPRIKMLSKIDEFYLETTGQKIIAVEQIDAKKQIIKNKSLKHKNILNEILSNPDIKDQFVLKLTYHTNSIEGSSLTEPDTAAIIFDNAAIPNKSVTEHLEAKNHQTALNYLFDYLSKNKKIDEDFILKIHGILMNGIITNAGYYRNHAVRIIGSNVPTANYIKISELITGIVHQIQEKTSDIINLSSEIHAQFEQIHPFSDGNGRVGRLLLNAMLLSNNLPPAVIKQEEKRLYYNYLNKAQIKNDLSQLENFICDKTMDGFKILERK